MELNSDILYLITIGASVGGSYILMNYRTTTQEAKIKAMFKKIDELSAQSIILTEKVKDIDQEKEEIIVLAKKIEDLTSRYNKFITSDSAEKKFITRKEFDIYVDNFKEQYDRLEKTIKNLDEKLDKIYAQITNISITLSKNTHHEGT